MYQKTLEDNETNNINEILEHILSDQLNVLKVTNENNRMNWEDLMELYAKEYELDLIKSKNNKTKLTGLEQNKKNNQVSNPNVANNPVHSDIHQQFDKMNENEEIYDISRKSQLINLSRIDLDQDAMNDESLMKDIEDNLNLTDKGNEYKATIPKDDVFNWDAILNRSQGVTVKVELDDRVWNQFYDSFNKHGSQNPEVRDMQSFKEKLLKEYNSQQLLDLQKSQVQQDVSAIQNDKSNSADNSNHLEDQSSAPKSMYCPVCTLDFLFDGLPKDNLEKLSVTLHSCYHSVHYLCILKHMKSLNKTTGECYECRKPQNEQTQKQINEFCLKYYQTESINSWIQKY